MENIRKMIALAAGAAISLCAAFAGGVWFGLDWSEDRFGQDRFITDAVSAADVPQGVDLRPFWKVWRTIDEKYVSGNGPTGEERMWGATKGLVESLEDPYSVFFPPVESRNFEDEVRGNFGGVGIEVGMRNDVLTVIAPLAGTPAARAGIIAGEKILGVNEVPTFGLSVDEAIQLIRGEVGTEVELLLLREEDGDEPRKVTIVREEIQIPTLEYRLRPDGIFVIALHNFSATAPDLFRSALREFAQSGTDKLIIDVRNNPGGFLEAALDMASWFLPAGKIVVSEKGAHPEYDRAYRSKGYNIFTDRLRLAILINGGSASAAEIFAAALSEHEKATLVGEQTFGKGSVQELVPITDTTSLKITVARWVTPNGISISKEGYAPDIAVPFTKSDYDAGKDPQLERAVEFLLAGI